MKHRLLCCLLALPFGLFAQTDTTDAVLDQAIEDLIQTTETDATLDYTLITDQLDTWRRRPLNLNKASVDQLRALPGLNDLQIAALMQHRAQFGALAHVNELQVVDGWYPDLIRGLRPYITVAELPDLKGTWSGDATQRLYFIPEQQRGYTAPDTATGDTNRYVGSRVQAYTRVRARMGNRVSLALVGEKDRGEAFTWNAKNHQYGPDFVGGHLALRQYGPVETLVLGDYTLAFGQGLALSRGLGLGKGAGAVTTVKGQAAGLRPYASVNEGVFMRGAAATFVLRNTGPFESLRDRKGSPRDRKGSLGDREGSPRDRKGSLGDRNQGQLRITVFGSRIRRDGSVSLATDTLTNEVIEELSAASSIQVTGMHRTASELAKRKTITETLAGGRIEHRSPTHTLGVTAFAQQYSPGIQPNGTFYNVGNFSGTTNSLVSVDGEAVWRNANFFGEVARSQSGGIAAAGGVLVSLHRTFDLALQARSFDRDYHSPYGFAFAERPTALSNERGLYLGGMFKPNRFWTVTGYVDQFFFPYARFGAYFPSHGMEYLVQVECTPRKGTSLILRYRSDGKEENIPTELSLPGPRGLQPVRKQNLRLQYRTKVSDGVTLSGRVEWCHFTTPTETADGFLAYQDVAVRAGRTLKLSGRYAVFHTPTYDARIYAYEGNVTGAFAIPAYAGIGSRWYLMAVYQPVSRLELWLRVAQSQYTTGTADRNPDPATNRYEPVYVLSSGLEEIQGLTKTEVTVQVRWRW